MYRLAKGIKRDPVLRWQLPDRVFFSCGASHILTYAFLTQYPNAGFGAVWIKPADGYTGNHIVAVRDDVAFDYHGYSSWNRLLDHTRTKSNRWWPGWHADVVSLPTDVLVSGPKSQAYDGLWLREPDQFLRNALPRAQAFVNRYLPPTHYVANQAGL